MDLDLTLATLCVCLQRYGYRFDVSKIRWIYLLGVC